MWQRMKKEDLDVPRELFATFEFSEPVKTFQSVFSFVWTIQIILTTWTQKMIYNMVAGLLIFHHK